MFLGWAGFRGVASINFKRHCGGYLKNAADASSVEQAEKRLAVAVAYIEKHKLNWGHTSVLWNTPDEDVEFWAKNLTNALEELKSLSENSTSLERSNMLMKLRETIMDDTGQGISVTVPKGISVFPNNTGLFWLPVLSLPVMLLGAFMAAHGARQRW